MDRKHLIQLQSILNRSEWYYIEARKNISNRRTNDTLKALKI